MDQQIDYLTRVQNIEIDSKAIKQRIAELSEQFETLDVRLQDFKVLMAEENQENDSINKEYRDYEVTVQDNLNLIVKSKDKLSMAKNNKEYQSSLKEIEELEKKNSAIEDDMLEILDKIETAEDKSKAREQEYAVLGEEVEQSRQKISAEIEAKQQAIEELNRNLADAREKIEPELLAIFERAKQSQANHIALARVVDEVCQGCNVTIPAQLYNELHRRDSIKFCPKCGRIAYWSESAR
jgi:predicted  nucleic acid-binding Zn-ribbon protein